MLFNSKADRQLEMAPKLGLNRAFWTFWTSNHTPARALRPLGMKVIAELAASGLSAAEDIAIVAGRTHESMLAFFWAE
ncbi:MAG: hypothetical protein AB7N24_19005 [Dehalococcoidia bacterium]